MVYDGGGCKINKAALIGLLSLFFVVMVNGVSGAREDPGSSRNHPMGLEWWVRYHPL